MSTFVRGEAFSSDSGPSLSVFLIEDFTCHLLSKVLRISREDIYVKKCFPFERQGGNHLSSFTKIPKKWFTSLLASPPNSACHLCLGNFAVSPVRFIVPGELCQCRTSLPVHRSLSDTSVLRLGICDLALNSWACLQNRTVFASAVAMSFRGLFVPTGTWILRFVVGKGRPWGSRRGIWGILKLKRFFSTRGRVPGGEVHMDWGIQPRHLKC